MFCGITYATSYRLCRVVKLGEWCTSRPLHRFSKHWVTPGLSGSWAHHAARSCAGEVGGAAGCVHGQLGCWRELRWRKLGAGLPLLPHGSCFQAEVLLLAPDVLRLRPVSYSLSSDPDSAPPAGFPGPRAALLLWTRWVTIRLWLSLAAVSGSPGAPDLPPFSRGACLPCSHALLPAHPSLQLAALLWTPLTACWNEKSLITSRGPWEQEITQAWQLQTYYRGFIFIQNYIIKYVRQQPKIVYGNHYRLPDCCYVICGDLCSKPIWFIPHALLSLALSLVLYLAKKRKSDQILSITILKISRF